jgi:hypothetical protein
LTRSEFFIAVEDEFGQSQGRALLRDLIVDELGQRSALVALDEGVAPQTVWVALCEAMQVPLQRRHGVGLPQPKADTPA